MKLSRRSVVLGSLTLPLLSSAAFAADKILASVPGLSFPFFVHMMNAFKAEIEAHFEDLKNEIEPGAEPECMVHA